MADPVSIVIQICVPTWKQDYVGTGDLGLGGWGQSIQGVWLINNSIQGIWILV